MAEQKESKRRVFFIAKREKEIFDHIRSGKKSVETRAATPRALHAKAGDIAVFLCAGERIEKRIKAATHFKSVAAMLKKYEAAAINPSARSSRDLLRMYATFPGYAEKLQAFGIIAIELQ